MHARPLTSASLMALFWLALLAPGCDKKTEAPEAAAGPAITAEEAAPFVQAWAKSAGEQVRAQATGAATEEALPGRFAKAIKEEPAAGAKEPAYAEMTKALYAARKFAPTFVAAGTLTPKGQAVWDILSQVEHDQLDPKPYDLETITQALGDLEGMKKEVDKIGEIQIGSAAQAWARTWVATQHKGHFALNEDGYAPLTKALMADDAGTSLKGQIKALGDLGKKMATTQALLEERLATGLARYTRQIRHPVAPDIFVHPRHDDLYNDPELRQSRPDEAKGPYVAGVTWRHAVFLAQAIAQKKGPEVLAHRTRDFVQAVLDTKAFAPLLATLSPSPQYDALKKEATRYEAIVQAGGWERVPEAKGLKQGRTTAAVKSLKKRLLTEGYLPQETDLTSGLFDQPLTDAIKAYQRTHQMEETGVPDRSFWRSLNVPAQERLAQIRLNQKRWVTSNVAHHRDETYVLVNLPDFHAEIWKDQKREMRMRVVIGNNDRVLNEETKKWEQANRTPTLSAYIDRAIYNPYWNVTPRIRQEETLVEVREDLEARYAKKVDSLIGPPPAPTTPKPLAGASAPTGALLPSLQGSSPASPTPPASTPGSKSVYATDKEGWKLNIPAFKAAYYVKKGTDPDLKALFPYLLPETGRVDVSITDPDNVPPWYEANGYEVMYPGKTWEYVRQLNGPENALGKVKVIFPNLHDVYLHDTPQKRLFERPLRAYSHGCMRMHEPLDFAAWLLKNDGQYASSGIDKVVGSADYTPVFLKKRVPVHVEYFTVRTDEEGRANFLIDIYKRDEEALKG